MEKDFWGEMNKKYNYTFFSGVPFKEASKLYNTMNSNFMHYVPASNELVALRLVTGARLSGYGSGILLDSYRLNKLDLDFNLKLNLPVLIITSYVDGNSFPKGLYYKYDLDKVMSYIGRYNRPAAFVL